MRHACLLHGGLVVCTLLFLRCGSLDYSVTQAAAPVLSSFPGMGWDGCVVAPKFSTPSRVRSPWPGPLGPMRPAPGAAAHQRQVLRWFGISKRTGHGSLEISCTPSRFEALLLAQQYEERSFSFPS